MSALTFREGPGYVDCDGARMERNQCEELIKLWHAEHDSLLRIGSIEAVCWARKIRKTLLDLEFAASVVWPHDPGKVVPFTSCTIRTIDRAWPAVPGSVG